jgi:DUF4097 and DUF4098 domain-containing protein YvlB
MASSRVRQNTFVGLCILAVLTATGCDVQMGNWGQARYEKIVDRDAALAAGATLDVHTSSGTITITGTDGAECSVIATIVARAPSEEEAQELGEQVEIRLEQIGNTLKVRADKPKLRNRRSISVSYAITTPQQTNVKCVSSYGSLKLANLEGTVHGKTGSGSIRAESVRGATNLDTSYGSITCTDVAGQEVTLHSGSGSITASDIKGAARMDSSYGPVKCERFSDGDLSLRSGSGQITVSDASFGTCEASSSYGSVIASNMEGQSAKLHSGSGNVDITEGTAKTLDMSSSYGRVKAVQITTTDLKAHSGSGSINVECTSACPAELTADVKTSYGSVSFTAPPAFSGQVHLATSYGSVQTERPITISGKVTKKKIAGTIGEGNGSLRLESGSGSIHLK